MVTIKTKDKRNIIFDNKVRELIFFIGSKKPFVYHTAINTVEFMLGGLLQINKKIFTFDCIYLISINNNEIELLAENLEELKNKPKIKVPIKDAISDYENQIKYCENTLDQNIHSNDMDAQIVYLRKKLSILFYLQWRYNIWK